jgi:hypothetical protein
LQRRWLTLALLWFLSTLTFELAGKPSTPHDLITSARLWSEFGNRLSRFFYWAFAKAVVYQRNGDLVGAREIYKQLLESVQEDLELNRNVRRYIEYNMRFSP